MDGQMTENKREGEGRQSKGKHTVRNLFVAALIFSIGWTVWGNTALMTEKITISGERLPAAFSGFRIVHLSDIHNAEFGEDNRTLLWEIAAQEPDIIAITGDLVDSNRTDIGVALDFVGEAVKIAPVCYVPGNHEAAITQYDTLKSGLEAAGVAVLEDKALRLERDGDKILLAGLKDPNFVRQGALLGENPDVAAARLEHLISEEDCFTILLSHRPELFETYVSSGADVVLSGHTHGGQFRLPFIGGLVAPHQGFFPKYDAGLFTEGNTNMIVSRGLGNSIIPIRFNNRPEIVVIELKQMR